MRNKPCIGFQIPNELLFLWLIGSAKCLLLGLMETYNLHTIDLCKIKDKSWKRFIKSLEWGTA